MLRYGRKAFLVSRAPQGARGLKCRRRNTPNKSGMSRPARGAWIEMAASPRSCRGRSPSRPARGAWIEIRRSHAASRAHASSRPARGAWIEMLTVKCGRRAGASRAPQGARGLKCWSVLRHLGIYRRAPQGARGLKSRPHRSCRAAAPVAPRKGRVD